MSKCGSAPIRSSVRRIMFETFNEEVTVHSEHDVTLNTIETQDNLLPTLSRPKQISFLDCKQLLKSYLRRRKGSNHPYMSMVVQLSNEKQTHSRYNYDLFDMLGDMGGVL